MTGLRLDPGSCIFGGVFGSFRPPTSDGNIFSLHGLLAHSVVGSTLTGVDLRQQDVEWSVSESVAGM